MIGEMTVAEWKSRLKAAYGYLRVSDPRQAEDDRMGLKRQESAIRKFAEEQGYYIVAFYQDSRSGSKELECRDGYFQMMAHLKEGAVKTVFIEKLDRLARSLLIQESIVADFQRQHYALLSSCEPDLCSTDPTRKMFRQIMGAVAEYECAMIAARMHSARRRKIAEAKAGLSNYKERKPYGWFPAERVVIAQVVALDAEGKSYPEIIKILTAQGTPTPRKHAKCWYPSAIQRILDGYRAKLKLPGPVPPWPTLQAPGNGQNEAS